MRALFPKKGRLIKSNQFFFTSDTSEINVVERIYVSSVEHYSSIAVRTCIMAFVVS